MDQNTNPEVGDSKVLPELPTQPQTPIQTLPEIKPTPVVETKLEPAGFKPKLPDNKNLGQMGKWLAVIILGLSLLFFIATSVFYALDNGGGIENVRITNVTANSATISWTTEDEVIGRVIWDDENSFMPFIFESIGKNVGYDDRDMVQVDLNQYELYLDGEKNGYTHHVTLRNLKPNTEYFFKVGSTKRYFSFGETSFKTFAVAEDILAPEPFYGKISSSEFDVFPPTDGIVYYRVDIKGDGTQYSNYHSTTIDPESGYAADMGYLLDSSGKPVKASKDSILQLSVETDRGNVMSNIKVESGVAPIPELLVTPAEASVDGELMKTALAYKDPGDITNEADSEADGKKSKVFKVKDKEGKEKNKTKIYAEKNESKNTSNPKPANKDASKKAQEKSGKDDKDKGKPYSPKAKDNAKSLERTESTVYKQKIVKNKADQAAKGSRSTYAREGLPDETSFDVGVDPNVNTAVDPNIRNEGMTCGGAASCASGQGNCNDCFGTGGNQWCTGNKVTCESVTEMYRATNGNVALIERIIPTARSAAERDGGGQVFNTLTNYLDTATNILEEDTARNSWVQYTQNNDWDYAAQTPVPNTTASVAPPNAASGSTSSAEIDATSISCPTVTCPGSNNPVQGVSVKFKGKLICKYSKCASTATFDENGNIVGCKSKGSKKCQIQEDPSAEGTDTVGFSWGGLINQLGQIGGVDVPAEVSNYFGSLDLPNTNPPTGGTIDFGNVVGYMGGAIATLGTNVPASVTNIWAAIAASINTQISNLPSCGAGAEEGSSTEHPDQCNSNGDVKYYCNGTVRDGICYGSLSTPVPTTVTPSLSGNTCSIRIVTSCGGNSSSQTFSVNSSGTDYFGGDKYSFTVNSINPDGSCSISGSKEPNYCDDQQSGIQGVETERVLGATTTSSSQVLQPGVYEISGDNSTSIRIEGDSVSVDVFLDANGDGVKQTSEPRIDLLSLDIKIEQVEKVVEYNVNLGWNLLGFEIVSSQWDRASELIPVINLQNINATHVATYQEGAWKLFSMRLDDDGVIQTFGDDFTILPGQGYFIKTNTFGSFSLTGNAFAESVPINMSNGWNLLSVQSPTAYNAQDFLNKCVSGGVQCDSLARYDSGLYEIVVSQGGTFFGNNFNLIKKSGYFVRVVGGGGKQITP